MAPSTGSCSESTSTQNGYQVSHPPLATTQTSRAAEPAGWHTAWKTARGDEESRWPLAPVSRVDGASAPAQQRLHSVQNLAQVGGIPGRLIVTKNGSMTCLRGYGRDGFRLDFELGMGSMCQELIRCSDLVPPNRSRSSTPVDVIIDDLHCCGEWEAGETERTNAMGAPSADLPYYPKEGGFGGADDVVKAFAWARRQEEPAFTKPLPIDPAAYNAADAATQVFMLINAERQDRGLATLERETSMMELLAYGHSREMAQHLYMDHESPLFGGKEDRGQRPGGPFQGPAGLECTGWQRTTHLRGDPASRMLHRPPDQAGPDQESLERATGQPDRHRPGPRRSPVCRGPVRGREGRRSVDARYHPGMNPRFRGEWSRGLRGRRLHP